MWAYRRVARLHVALTKPVPVPIAATHICGTHRPQPAITTAIGTRTCRRAATDRQRSTDNVNYLQFMTLNESFLFIIFLFSLLVNITEAAPGQRKDSESDSDGSQADGAGRSLDLASSHSSDEDDVASRRTHKNMGVTTQQTTTVAHNYLPNIHSNPTEHLNILCSNAELFPNIKPIYAPRWSSQLPEAYLPSNGSGS